MVDKSHYKIINGEHIALVEGDYQGILYQYGCVSLIPEMNQLRLKFDYNVLSEKKPDDIQAFIQYIGDILRQLIEEKSAKRELVFRGGADTPGIQVIDVAPLQNKEPDVTHRTEDSSQSDS